MLTAAARDPDGGAAAFEQAIRFREALYRVFAAIATGQSPGKDDLGAVNGVLAETLGRSRLASVDGGFAWAWDGEESGLDRPLWAVAYAAAALLTGPQLGRARVCPGAGCGWLFLDTSRNRSRRWCDMGICGNRAKARRHYQRRRAAKTPGG